MIGRVTLAALAALAAFGPAQGVTLATRPATARVLAVRQDDARTRSRAIWRDLQERVYAPFERPFSKPRPPEVTRDEIRRVGNELLALLEEEDEEWAARILWGLGKLAGDRGALWLANRALERAHEIRANSLAVDHVRLVLTRRNLIRSRALLGDHDGALTLALLELEVQEGRARRDAARSLDARCELALLLAESGQLEAARGALAAASREYAASDDVIATRQRAVRLELAITDARAGEWDLACDDFGRVLSESREWLFAKPEIGSIMHQPPWQTTYVGLAMHLGMLAPSEPARGLLRPLASRDRRDVEWAESWCADFVAALRDVELPSEQRAEVFTALANLYASSMLGYDPA